MYDLKQIYNLLMIVAVTFAPQRNSVYRALLGKVTSRLVFHVIH